MIRINRNLFTKELKRNRKNLFIWTAVVVGFTLLVLSVFPFMSEMGKDMAILIENMPIELQKAMGMTSETWSSILGFYSTYFGIYIVVLVSIYSASTATNIISKEEKEGTSEFLFTKPISRTTIFWSKISSLFFLMIAIFLIQSGSAFIGVYFFAQQSVDWIKLLFMQANGFFLVLFFTSLGLLISMFMKPKNNFMGLVVGITFGSYILNAIAKSTEATNWIGYFTPFHYIDFDVSMKDYTFEIVPALIFVFISLMMLAISLIQLRKKDFIT